jgi:hypothetical protein
MKKLWVFLALCFVISCNLSERKQAKQAKQAQLAEKHKRDSLYYISVARKQRSLDSIQKENDEFYAKQRNERTNEDRSDVYKTSNQPGRCIINKSDVFAATSKANFDMLFNCLANGDKQAVESMVLNGQVKFLHQNDVLYLVSTKLFGGYCIIRPEGSTEELYVNIEAITPQ